MNVKTLFLLLALTLTAAAQRKTEKAKPAPAPAPPPATEGAAKTVVVYNERDPDAAALAKYYASKRRIPSEQVVALKCSTEEEISREEFDTQIAVPLREAFVKKGWWKIDESESEPGNQVKGTRIHFMALIRGMPLKIKPHFEKYEGDKAVGPPQIATHNEGSVDSDLAVLGIYTRQISGVLVNPFFRSAGRIGDTPYVQMLLVCRLDAPTPEMVRRMIDDSIAAEQAGLRGMMYVDARGTTQPGLVDGDKWLFAAAEIGRKKGLPVVLDSGEGLFPVPYPMTRAAVYLGWYADTASGPFVRPDFKFERGAVAVHIHSFSASTLRDPKRAWCAPLVAAGAAATMGNVYEPYLGLTPVLEVFFDRLRAGFTFGESCYMSQRYLSWMPVFVGDPLYRPFAVTDAPVAEPKNEWDAYRLGARAWYEQGPEAGATLLKASARKYSSGVIMEGLGLLQLAANDGDGAVESFGQAATLYRQPDDIVRSTIHEVFQLKAMNRTPDAIKVARKQIERYHKHPSAEVLRVIEAGMTVSTSPAPSAAPR